MKSPFEIKNSANNNVKLATHDWTHCNNISFGIGKITPTLCELVPNKSSLSFAARTGLQFMPMVFPNQTRMFCRQSFFKVPLRTLWEDYMDYVGASRSSVSISISRSLAFAYTWVINSPLIVTGKQIGRAHV